MPATKTRPTVHPVKVTYKEGFAPKPEVTTPHETAEVTTTSKQSHAVRSITNKTRYRLQKRINLYLRSIAVAKDKKKIAVLNEKVKVLTFALDTFNQVVAESTH